MPVWDDVVPASDMAVYRAAGYGKPQGFGERPAVLVIDVNYAFVGHRPEPILESIKTWRHSCGERGWSAVRNIQHLLDAARAAATPIIYTTGDRSAGARGLRPDKNYRSGEDGQADLPRAPTDIVEEIAPRDGDLLIRKQRASAFFGTTLVSYLIRHGVDTLLVAGTTTSGCVRASAVDAHSYDFRVSIVEECVADRWEISHKIALFDLHAKYADVISLRMALDYLRQAQARAAAPAEGR